MTNVTSSSYNKYCWYWASEPTYQSIKPASPDIEHLFWLRKLKVSEYQTVRNSKCVSTLLNTDNWKGFLDTGSRYGEYAVGGPTLEMWCNSWNDAHASSKIYTNVEASETDPGYYVGNSESATTNTYMISGVQDTRDRLWIPHYSDSNTFDGDNKCSGYWLTSPQYMEPYPGLNNNARCLSWSNGCFLSFGDFASWGKGLRPVVALKTGVSASKDANGVWQLK